MAGRFRKIVQRTEELKTLRDGVKIYFYTDVLECGHTKRVRTDPDSGTTKRLCRFCKKGDK